MLGDPEDHDRQKPHADDQGRRIAWAQALALLATANPRDESLSSRLLGCH
jgi:hypothetical protein